MFRKFINSRKLTDFFIGYRVSHILRNIPIYLFRWLRKDGFSCHPLVVTIELTHQCNLSCVFCYFNGMKKIEASLGRKDIEKMLNGLNEYKTSIHLTGGEPFLRDDLYDIIACIKKRNFYCTINTNGSLISEERTPWLKQFCPDHLLISLNSNKFGNDKSNLAKESFDRIIGGIRYLVGLRRAKQVSVNIILNSFNIDRIIDFLMLVKGLGVKRICFQHVMPTLEAAMGRNIDVVPDSIDSSIGLVDHAKLNSTIKVIKEKARAERIRIRFSPELKPREVIQWYLGGYSRRCFYHYFGTWIEPDGNVYVCQRFRRPLGNIKEINLLDIWKSENYRVFRKRSNLPYFRHECKNCCKI